MLSGNFQGSEIRHGIFWGLIFGPGIFLGFVGNPKDFFWALIFPPFDHPRHLKSGVEKKKLRPEKVLTPTFFLCLFPSKNWGSDDCYRLIL